jgi:transposase
MAKSKNSEVLLADNETGELLNIDEGIEIQYTKQYGVGCDCHSKFLQISVLVKRDITVLEYKREFNTDWDSVVKARDWILSVLETCASPPADVSGGIHYCIESTSVYHVVVLKAWDGMPSVINPSIAGASKKKTDVLDARQLAIFDLTGTWRESFVPSGEIDELRVLLAERNNFNKLATRCSNRINNTLLKFGYTLGRDGSVTNNNNIREVIEDQISDHPSEISGICPLGIPEDVKTVFSEGYRQYDMYHQLVSEYDRKIIAKIRSMKWETGTDTIDGNTMMRLLCTAPGIGEKTAILWMARIVTPRRFPNKKALAAYCALDPSLKVSAGKVTSTVKRGGCKDLHSMLCQAASNLVRRHNEPFGRWGYNIAVKSGRWKKGISAVARKLAVALYYISIRGEAFSYEKYKIMTEPDVIDISIEQLASIDPAFKRYVRILMSNGIKGTKSLVHEYYICNLSNIKGLGQKFYGALTEFIENQSYYKDKVKENEEMSE